MTLQERIDKKRAELEALERQQIVESVNTPPKQWALALHEAVAAQYFKEEHKYRAHLYDVMEALSPDVAALFDRDPQAAFDLTHKMAELSSEQS